MGDDDASGWYDVLVFRKLLTTENVVLSVRRIVGETVIAAAQSINGAKAQEVEMSYEMAKQLRKRFVQEVRRIQEHPGTFWLPGTDDPSEWFEGGLRSTANESVMPRLTCPVDSPPCRGPSGSPTSAARGILIERRPCTRASVTPLAGRSIT